MSPELTTLEGLVTAKLLSLSAAQTQLTPLGRPDRWSIQQIVEHLLLTYRLTATSFETRLAKGTPTRATSTLRQRLGQFTLIRLGHFPSGHKAPAAVFPGTPSILHTGAEISTTLHATLERLDSLINQAEALFGPRSPAISHQILGPLTSQQWRCFHLIHARHHLKQIETIRKDHSL